MQIKSVDLFSYQIPMKQGSDRSGIILRLINDLGDNAWGEVAPLPNFSKETYDEVVHQLKHISSTVKQLNWTAQNFLSDVSSLSLYPSVAFGLESAIFSLMSPMPDMAVKASGLLMGSPKEIFDHADFLQQQGFTSAKLKLRGLSFRDAKSVVDQLKDRFFLRLDVNRSWETDDSIRFFSQYPTNLFDYVEEPFKIPRDLAKFTHPLAIDESFPDDLSYEDLEQLPKLKAMIYKPTIQGGMGGCLALQKWAKARGVDIVLSSTFESDVGLSYVSSIAALMSLQSSVGIGTYHYLSKHLNVNPMCFLNGFLHLPNKVIPDEKKLLKIYF